MSMRVHVIRSTARFDRHYRKLSTILKNIAKKKEVVFRDNPFDASLDTHKLSGKDQECWSFSLNRKYRIKFYFLDNEEVLFLDVGTHDIYE